MQLPKVHRQDSFDRFQFNDDAVFDQEVDAEVEVQGVGLVVEGDLDLALVGDALEGEFGGQAFFVDVFQEAGAQVAVDFYGGAYDLVEGGGHCCPDLSGVGQVAGMGGKAVRVVVSGGVQGVGFRYFTRREAERLGVVGWVRNRRDGTVEVWAQGDGVDALLAWLREGPPAARVQGCEVEAVEAVEAVELEGFEILSSV